MGATRPGANTWPPLRSSFAGGVTGIPGVIYRTLDGYRPLDLDLYLPPSDSAAARRPLVVYVHGGGWYTASARDLVPFVDAPAVFASVAARGFVLASVNYRLSGEARFPAALEDVKAAIAFLRSRAGDYGIDPGRVAVWGASAGGQLAMLATLDCRDDCVQAGVSWYGAVDLRARPSAPAAAAGPSTASRYLGCEPAQCPEQTLRRASAATFASSSSPPVLLLHGSADRAVEPRQSRDLATALRNAGARAEYVEIADVGHNFLGATPEATKRANAEGLRRTIEFLERELAPGAAAPPGAPRERR